MMELLAQTQEKAGMVLPLVLQAHQSPVEVAAVAVQYRVVLLVVLVVGGLVLHQHLKLPVRQEPLTRAVVVEAGLMQTVMVAQAAPVL
jgi:hypothetical protein